MKKAYLGIDIGSEFIKGVIIDKDNNIIVSDYLYIDGNPISATKRLISILNKRLNVDEYRVISIGTTGSARKIVGNILGADVIRNEIFCHVIGINSLVPNIRTVIDIGGQDIKIITLKEGRVIDYNIDNIYILDCVEGLLLNDNKERIIIDYLIDIYKNEKLIGPISIQGGCSKNKNIVKCVSDLVNGKVYIDKMSEFLGALGVAILARNNKEGKYNNYFNVYEQVSVLND